MKCKNRCLSTLRTDSYATDENGRENTFLENNHKYL